MCDNIFTSSSDCTTYLWRHTGDRPFLWKYNLKINSRKYTEEKAFPRIQRDQDFMQNSSFMVSDIWEIAIVIRLFHRNINFRYTQGCTLGKSHTYAAIWTTLGKNIIRVAIVTKLSKGKGIFLYTWGLTLVRNYIATAIGINLCSFLVIWFFIGRYIQERDHICANNGHKILVHTSVRALERSGF